MITQFGVKVEAVKMSSRQLDRQIKADGTLADFVQVESEVIDRM